MSVEQTAAERGWLVGSPFGRLFQRAATSAVSEPGQDHDVARLTETVMRGRDRDIQFQALRRLGQLCTLDAVDALCEVWADNRHPALGSLLRQKNWAASAAAQTVTRVLTLLNAGRLSEIDTGNADLAGALLVAADDRDPVLAARARIAFGHLRSAAMRNEVWRLALWGGHARGEEALLRAGVAPCTGELQALRFYLHGSLTQYQKLDPQGTILRSWHQRSPEPLRRRLAEAGRKHRHPVWADYLLTLNPEEVRLEEWEGLAEVLAFHERWTDLFAAALRGPARWSASVLNSLQEVGWQPEGAAERARFGHLSALARKCVGTQCTGSEWLPTLARPLPPLKQAPIVGGAVVADGTGLAIAAGKSVVVYRLSDGGETRVLDTGGADILHFVSSPDGARAVAAGEGGLLSVWDLATGETPRVLTGPADAAEAICFTQDGQHLAVAYAHNPGIHLWDLRADTDPVLLHGHSAPVQHLAVTADPGLMVSTDASGAVGVWHLEDATPVGWIRETPRGVGPGYLGKGGLIVRLGEDGIVRAWSLSTEECVLYVTGSDGRPVKHMVVAEDGYTVAGGNDEGALHVWRLPDGELIHTLWAHSGPIVKVDIREDRLITGGLDGCIRLWSRADGALLSCLGGHHGADLLVAAHRDSETWVTGDGTGCFQVWHSRLAALLGTPLGSFGVEQLDEARALLCGVAPDGAASSWLELILATADHQVPVGFPSGSGPGPAFEGMQPTCSVTLLMEALNADLQGTTSSPDGPTASVSHCTAALGSASTTAHYAQCGASSPSRAGERPLSAHHVSFPAPSLTAAGSGRKARVPGVSGWDTGVPGMSQKQSREYAGASVEPGPARGKHAPQGGKPTLPKSWGETGMLAAEAAAWKRWT